MGLFVYWTPMIFIVWTKNAVSSAEEKVKVRNDSKVSKLWQLKILSDL